jgi:hypothetical protein
MAHSFVAEKILDVNITITHNMELQFSIKEVLKERVVYGA